MFKKGDFVKGETYKVNFSFRKRAVTMVYEGDMYETDYNANECPNGIAKFHSKANGGIFAPYETIEKAVLVDPTKARPKKAKPCPRCLGNKMYEHLAHVNGGRCFKCDGTGVI